MERAALNTVASARGLVGVTVGVVIAFVFSTPISASVEKRGVRDTNLIVANAMPSLQLLSLVRGDLRAIDRALGDGRIVAERRRSIDAALASYTAMPFLLGEQALYSPIPELLHRLDAQLAAAPMSAEDIEATIDEIDRTVERIETFDATESQRLGRAIERTRSDSHALTLVLSVVTGLVALVVLTLAVRGRRRATRALIDEIDSTQQGLASLRTKVDELAHFAGRVAHDIRNPLHAALTALQLVREDCPQVPTAVDTCTAALQRMNRMVDDLLGFARAGGKPLPDASSDMAAVVRDVVDGMAGEVEAADIALSAEGPTDAPVCCATGVMTSIVANLVRNAVVHMGIAVERRVSVRISAAGPRWRLEVQDTGPGIPPGQEQRIFEPHVQLDRVPGGSGLGLATVERLVTAHGGALGVVSAPGCGALFWVELPGRWRVP